MAAIIFCDEIKGAGGLPCFGVRFGNSPLPPTDNTVVGVTVVGVLDMRTTGRLWWKRREVVSLLPLNDMYVVAYPKTRDSWTATLAYAKDGLLSMDAGKSAGSRPWDGLIL